MCCSGGYGSLQGDYLACIACRTCWFFTLYNGPERSCARWEKSLQVFVDSIKRNKKKTYVPEGARFLQGNGTKKAVLTICFRTSCNAECGMTVIFAGTFWKEMKKLNAGVCEKRMFIINTIGDASKGLLSLLS